MNRGRAVKQAAKYVWSSALSAFLLGALAADVANRASSWVDGIRTSGTLLIVYAAGLLVFGASLWAAGVSFRNTLPAMTELARVGRLAGTEAGLSDLAQVEARLNNIARAAGVEGELRSLLSMDRSTREGYVRTIRHMLNKGLCEGRALPYYFAIVIGQRVLDRGNELHVAQQVESAGSLSMIEISLREEAGEQRDLPDDFGNYLTAVTTCIEFFDSQVAAMFTFDASVMPIEKYFHDAGISDGDYSRYLGHLDGLLPGVKDKVFILQETAFDDFHRDSRNLSIRGCLEYHRSHGWNVYKVLGTENLARELSLSTFAGTCDFGAIFPLATPNRCWVFETGDADERHSRTFRIRSVEGLTKDRIMTVFRNHGLEQLAL